jgi:hypothetical protein
MFTEITNLNIILLTFKASEFLFFKVILELQVSA